MSDGKAERMVGTVKRDVSRIMSENGVVLEDAITKVLYCYRRSKGSEGPYSLVYMYVKTP